MIPTNLEKASFVLVIAVLSYSTARIGNVGSRDYQPFILVLFIAS